MREWSPLPANDSASPETGESTGKLKSIADAVEIRDITIDDLANVRALHVISLRALAAEHLDEGEIGAMTMAINDCKYSDALLRARPIGAWLDGRLIGTAGWLRTVDRNAIARIEYVHVDPLFVRLGIGRRLVRHVEALAKQAGIGQLSARPTFNAVTFFERLGYRATSFGVRMVNQVIGVPVAHMRLDDNQLAAPRPKLPETEPAGAAPADDGDVGAAMSESTARAM